MALVAFVASPILLAPYLTFDRDNSRIDTATPFLFAVLVVHVLCASLAITVGVLQLVPRIRRRRILHRRLGRAFLCLGIVAFSVTALPLALLTSDGNTTRFGTLVPATLWLGAAYLGWTAARDRRFADHRDWMVRTYALAFFALTTRMLVPLLLLAQLPWLQSRYDGDRQAAIDATIPYGQWLGWIIDLAIAEYVIRTRLRRRPAEGAALA
jgi:uncharacterized membrane protein